MGVLDRLKKKKHDGFKQFVCSLEQTAGQKRKDIMTKAILEDPIYVKHALKNMLPFDHVTELSSDDIDSLMRMPNIPKMFARALATDPMKDDFIATLPNNWISKVKEEIEYVGELKPADVTAAKIFILKNIRELQDNNTIAPFQWDFPDDIILIQWHRGMRDGEFKDYFENEILAIEGELKKGKRIGIWKHYYDNGKLMAEGNYENGLKEDEWTYYYSSGKVKMKGQYKEDSKHGDWVLYDAEGNESQQSYELGKLLD